MFKMWYKRLLELENDTQYTHTLVNSLGLKQVLVHLAKHFQPGHPLN